MKSKIRDLIRRVKINNQINSQISINAQGQISTDTQVEFGYELISVIPYAYYHFKKRNLVETISCMDTKPFYYFSKNHTEKYTSRVDGTIVPQDCPNSLIHKDHLNLEEWLPPDYKKQFMGDKRFQFEKPLLLISNKYANEWREGPANFLDIPLLDDLFNKYKDKYQIIYNRFTSDQAPDDSIQHYEFSDFEFIRNLHKGVIILHDLCDRNKEFTYNNLIVRLFSNCEKFISVQGGTSILSSYFGGTNIIYAVKGGEVRVNSYDNWYDKFSGCNIIHCKKYSKILESTEKYF